MRQIFAIFILLFMQMVQAQNEILAPVLVDGQQIAVALEQTTSDSSVLDKLREALKEDAMKEHAQSQKDGWFKSANHRFAPESITFFLATGLVIYETAWGKSHGDPVAMERHILSLKDPIASMSFYAFMQANGFYMNKKSKGLPASMDQGTRAQMMRRFSYGGMVWGSLASSLISDVFSPFKPCLDKMFSSDYRNENHLQERCEKDLSASFAQWNLRNKFGQYAPQIISLILSQKASEFATTLISNLAGGVSNTSSRIAKSELATKYLVNDVTKKLVFKISRLFSNIFTINICFLINRNLKFEHTSSNNLKP